MASSSTAQQACMVVEYGKSLTIKHKTIDINQNGLKLLVKQIVDFDSFNQNGCGLWSYFRVQEWSYLFDMLNETTYPRLVKDFWVKAKVFDEYFVVVELSLLVQKEISLKGKSREKVGLKKFEEV